jgi:hypothetical protein
VTRPRRPAPSWLGTLVVVIAVLVMLWRASLQLRHAVTPNAPAPSSSTPH